MKKNELIEAMALKAGITSKEASTALDAFVEVVTETLKAGDSIQLVGVLSLKVGHREERIGRNPSTGEQLTIPAKKIIKFKAGKSLDDAIQ